MVKYYESVKDVLLQNCLYIFWIQNVAEKGMYNQGRIWPLKMALKIQFF